MGEVLAGILLGPTLLGKTLPGVEAALFPTDITPYIAVTANLDPHYDEAKVVQVLRELIAHMHLPIGYRTSLEGDFREGEKGRLMLSILTPVSILLILTVLQQRFRSIVLCLIIMGNIPLALVGSVAALWLVGMDLNLAAMIGSARDDRQKLASLLGRAEAKAVEAIWPFLSHPDRFVRSTARAVLELPQPVRQTRLGR